MKIRFVSIIIASTRFFTIDSFSIASYYESRSSKTLSLRSNKQDPELLDVHIKLVASAGLTNDELPIILSEVRSALADDFGVQMLTKEAMHDANASIPSTVPGALGRVLLLSLENVAEDWGESDERLDPFKNTISNQLDNLVGNHIEQPILLSFIPNFTVERESNITDTLQSIIEREVTTYDLRKPIVSIVPDDCNKISPTIHVEIDGAMVPDPYLNDKEVWDTSTILVYDDFVDSSLRQKLLDVINKRDINYIWDDKLNGPNPERWVRGGLKDTFNDDSKTCWGLTEDATYDLCFLHHKAIADVEKKIASLFSPRFVVTRLPEAVLGPFVSPLTANAPTFGDKFSYHIDADPYQAPPSPWTDVFGRYFNRGHGKPRFVSCLLYLNDEWSDDLGAPTQFYDPPTEEVYQVFPRPGRCVIMDQDVTHTVVAPNEIAGALPRYSLVWKLILHPVVEGQSMKFSFGCESPLLIGSAKKEYQFGALKSQG